MSVYAHLSSSVDSYQLYVNNKSTEDDLDSNEISSASEWLVHLEPCIDIANLLYCKSDIAQAKVTSIAINSLPLCYSKSEKISIFVHLPPELAGCNQLFNTENLEKFNDMPYYLQLEDLITNVPTQAVTYVDEKLHLSTIHVLLRSTLRIILDTQVFLEDHYPKLSINDIKILHFYVDIATFSRLVIHKQLCPILQINEDLEEYLVFKDKRGISKRTENKWLSESSSLRPIDERPNSGFGDNNMNLEIFNEINFETAYRTPQDGGPVTLIHRETLRWLNDIMVLDTEDEDSANLPLTPLAKKTLTDIITANKNLILLASKTRAILDTLEKHIKKTTGTKAQDDLIRLKFNEHTKKVKFTINPKPFFNELGVSLTVKLPKHCSQILGASGKNAEVRITACYDRHNTMPTVLINNNLQHSSQMLAFPVRPIPRVIYLVSDLCQNLKRDFWLRNSKYENCHLLSCVTLDDSCIESGFIHVVNPDADNHRLSNSKLLLNQFHVHLIDDQFRKILFQQKTYVSLQIVISPYVSP